MIMKPRQRTGVTSHFFRFTYTVDMSLNINIVKGKLHADSTNTISANNLASCVARGTFY